MNELDMPSTLAALRALMQAREGDAAVQLAEGVLEILTQEMDADPACFASLEATADLTAAMGLALFGHNMQQPQVKANVALLFLGAYRLGWRARPGADLSPFYQTILDARRLLADLLASTEFTDEQIDDLRNWLNASEQVMELDDDLEDLP